MKKANWPIHRGVVRPVGAIRRHRRCGSMQRCGEGAWEGDITSYFPVSVSETASARAGFRPPSIIQKFYPNRAEFAREAASLVCRDLSAGCPCHHSSRGFFVTVGEWPGGMGRQLSGPYRLVHDIRMSFLDRRSAESGPSIIPGHYDRARWWPSRSGDRTGESRGEPRSQPRRRRRPRSARLGWAVCSEGRSNGEATRCRNGYKVCDQLKWVRWRQALGR